MTKQAKPRAPKATQGYIYVGIQIVILCGLAFLRGPEFTQSQYVAIASRALELIGAIILLIAIFDLRRSLTMLPEPTRQGQLQIRGIYRFVRHPMYTGVMAIAFGIAIGSNWYIKLILATALVVLFIFKARYEERLLRARYPEYEEYMSKTHRFLPGI